MRILGSILILFVSLLADVRVYLKQNPIYQGEPAKLVIEATGDEIVMPKIDKIGPYPVASVAHSESVINVNGNLSVKKAIILTFYPDQNVTIPPISVKVNDKTITSKPLQLIVKKAKPNSDIFFTLKVDKKEAYVSEPIVAELELKIKRTLNIVDYSFEPPKFENFWVKELKSSNKYLEEHGEYLIKRIKFLLLPQKSGVLYIAPAVFKYAVPDTTRDLFGFSITAPKWKSVVSNSVSIVVKPLPADVELVGDFTIDANVDKRELKTNEPCNFRIKIEGIGNLESFDGIDLNISDVTIYKDKPKLQERYTKNGLLSSFEQKFSIIADRSYTIPAIKLRYFSLKEKKIKELQTKPIDIKIVDEKRVAPHIQQPKHEVSEVKRVATAEPKSVWGYFVLGFALGFGVALLIGMVGRFFNKKSVSFKWSGKKELLNRLLPYVAKDKRAAAMAQVLYEEIYEKKRHNISKKEVEQLLKNLV